MVFGRNWPPVFTIFGSPQGPPDLQKKRVFPENGVSTTAIFSIFAVNAAATNFFIETAWLFDQKTVVFFVYVLQVVLYFCGHGDPHDTS